MKNASFQHINEMSYKIDLPNVLARTESLLIQVQRMENVPPEIALLIRHPNPEVQSTADISEKSSTEIHTSQGGNDEPCQSPVIATLSNSTSAVEQESMQQRTCEEVVELSENTKSVF